MNKSKRNLEIDLCKFIFSIIIVLLHSFNLFNGKFLYMPGGSIGVDFFFIVTGYLLMNSIEKHEGITGGELLWRKFKIIMPAFYLSVILAFIMRTIFSIDNGPILHKILLLINEASLLQAAGFVVYPVTGSAWYLSAMFIAIAILFPIANNYKEYFSNLLSLVIGILVLGPIASNGHISDPGLMINGIIFLGLLKGIAEISLGCFAYSLVKKINALKINNKIKVCLTLIKYITFCLVIYFAACLEVNSYFLSSCVIILFIGIVLTFSEQTFSIGDYFKNNNFFGEFSLCIYLNNFYWGLIISKVFADYSDNSKLLIYLSFVFLSSTIIYISSKFIKNKSQIFLQQLN